MSTTTMLSMDIPLISAYIIAWAIAAVKCSVTAPPWGDSKKNPCTSKPNGWQLLYWPQDGECYRIFQKGYPCPDSMEITPSKDGLAECNCPPGTAQNARDAMCYKLYSPGPCKENEYFGPVVKLTKSSQGRRWGSCFEIEDCGIDNVFWPRDSKCYAKKTKGPCPEGLLLNTNSGGMGECICDKDTMKEYYWETGMSCHEPLNQGPCQRGEIFLPNGECGCEKSLKQYNQDDGLCYTLESQGPCKRGQIFDFKSNNSFNKSTEYSKCYCKDGYVQWEKDGACYEPFTRGPCTPGEMFEVELKNDVNSMSCVPLPCGPGELYFQDKKGCHKVGVQGPCLDGEVVLFKRLSPQSTDGVSYLGQCGCNYIQDENSFYPTLTYDDTTEKSNCSRLSEEANLTASLPETSVRSTMERNCGTRRKSVLWDDNECWDLYTQGPCKEGEWLVPDRGKGQREGRGWRYGKCECRPGFTTIFSDDTTLCYLSIDKYFPGKVIV